jgi:hypothetical protein
MAQTETGHATNLANFDKLTGHIQLFGVQYNPVPDRLKYGNLISVLAGAKTSFEALNTANPPYLIAISNRESAFSQITKLLSRIVKAAEILSVNPASMKALKELVRKLRGGRAVAKKSQDELAEGEKPVVYRSVSQLSFDQRIEHFAELVSLLQGQPEYIPNEQQLTVVYLNTLLNDMRVTNTAVTESEIPVTKARNERNVYLYAPETGIISLAQDVKKYVQSTFGNDSAEYKEIQKLKFKKISI